MFTVLSLKKSYMLAADELRYLLSMLQRYAVTPDGDWLASLLQDREPNFYWCEAMETGDVLGCFTPIRPDAIYLQPREQTVPDAQGRVFWLELIFDTVVHELRHMFQYRRHPFLYVLCALPGLRQLTLEKDAKSVEDGARRFAKNWSAMMDSAAYISRYGCPPEEYEK